MPALLLDLTTDEAMDTCIETARRNGHNSYAARGCQHFDVGCPDCPFLPERHMAIYSTETDTRTDTLENTGQGVPSHYTPVLGIVEPSANIQPDFSAMGLQLIDHPTDTPYRGEWKYCEIADVSEITGRWTHITRSIKGGWVLWLPMEMTK
jgi:hypothetical protein